VTSLIFRNSDQAAPRPRVARMS